MSFVPTSMTRAIGKAVVLVKKNQPHILFGGGVVGVVTGTVLACRATLSLEEKIDEINVSLDKVQSLKNVVSQSEYNRLVAREYLNACVTLGRLYGPSALVVGGSIAALTSSHIQLSRRNAALTAAYAGVTKMFDEYRERVRAEIGEEREQDIYLNAQEIVVDEDGKKVKVKSVNGLPNQFARLFDKNNHNWRPSPGYNRNFLQAQQNYANDKLRVDGYVFLNDIYDWLGFDRTQIGQLVGWTVNSDDGDGYISFGLDQAFNVRGPNYGEFDGWTCILDFNVEGIVYDKI